MARTVPLPWCAGAPLLRQRRGRQELDAGLEPFTFSEVSKAYKSTQASLASGAKTLPPKAAGPTPKAPEPPLNALSLVGALSEVEGIGSAWGQPAGAPPPGAPHANGALGASWGDPVPAKAPAAPADPRVDWFCRQHGLDAVVERRLRQLAPDAQRRVMDEGPIGANPSFEVTSRIHRIEAWEHGHHVSSFCAHHIVSPQAQDALKALSPDIARKVMSTPLTSPDPSSELLARCNDAGKDFAVQ